MTKHKINQNFIRYYRDKTGITDVDMHEAAKWGVEKSLLKLPKPKSAYDLLARQLAESAREETRTDKKTGQPYRVNHMYTESHGNEQLHLWIDIDHPSTTRKKMHKSLIRRREQMVGDGVQLTLDALHWDRIHPSEEPIEMPMDFTLDVALRLNAPNEESEAS